MANASKKQDQPTVVKKYANRRLYDTGRSSYVTLEDLAEMIKEGHDFVVIDAKSEEDITRQVLTQIIVDQEAKGENLLPIPFLRQLIGFYGDNLQSLVPNYLEHALNTFTKNQERFQEQVSKSFGNIMNPVNMMEELSRKNMEMFETAMSAWMPFAPGVTRNQSGIAPDPKEKIKDLKKNIAEMEKEIERLQKEA